MTTIPSFISSTTALSSLPTPTTTTMQTAASSTPSPAPTSSSSGPSPINNYVIILGVTTCIFLVTTLVCSVIVLIMCCQKMNARRGKKQPRKAAFEGIPSTTLQHNIASYYYCCLKLKCLPLLIVTRITKAAAL